MSNTAQHREIEDLRPQTRSHSRREPKTKAELLDRILQNDFTGDFHDLVPNRHVSLKRTGNNTLQLQFLDSGKSFSLVIRKPRTEDMLARSRARRRKGSRHTPANDQGENKRRPGRPRKQA